jgi:hypothetical protein
MIGWLNKNRVTVQWCGMVFSILVALSFVYWRDVTTLDGARIDSNDIVNMANGEEEWLDDHYQAVGELYSDAGLIDKPWVVGTLAVLVMSGVVIWLGRRGMVGWGAWGISMVAILLTGYYMGALSKDVFALIVIAVGGLVVIGRKEWWWTGVMAVLMLGLAWWVRPYWAVIAGLFVCSVVAWSVIQRWKWARRWRVGIFLGALVLMVIVSVTGYMLANDGEVISAIREWINTNTNLADTRIWNPLPSDSWFGGVVNSLWVLIGFFVPFTLIVLWPWYTMAAVCFVALMGYWLGWMWRGRNKRWSVGEIRAVALVGAYLVVASLFEPDYSSLLRHLTVIMPFMVYCYVRPEKHKKEAIS